MREEIKIKILQNMLEEVTKKYDYFIAMQQNRLDKTFQMAIRDQLTGLYNRQYFVEYTKKSLQRGKREENKSILIFIDLDRFKQVNDNFGHKRGDELLQETASILEKTFRDYDIVVRFGGDEFIVYMENINFKDSGLNELLQLFTHRIKNGFKKYDVCASYGYSIYPDEAKDLNTLIETADKRMYKYKQEHKR